MGRLLSVNVGLPRDVAWQGKTVHTGIWKAPVKGRRMARHLNIDGDGQGDFAGHGAVPNDRRKTLKYLTKFTLLRPATSPCVHAHNLTDPNHP